MILGYTTTHVKSFQWHFAEMSELSDSFFKSSGADMPSLEQSSFPDHGTFPLMPEVASFLFGLYYLRDKCKQKGIHFSKPCDFSESTEPSRNQGFVPAHYYPSHVDPPLSN